MWVAVDIAADNYCLRDSGRMDVRSNYLSGSESDSAVQKWQGCQNRAFSKSLHN